VKPLETEEELAEIYRIHCDWNVRKGNVADSFEQMRIAAGQTENRQVFIAKVDGKVVAGSFYRFCPGGVVEYSANFSRPEYQRLRPNDLIGWRAIEWACGTGASYFSMGGSHMFLRRFGGEVIRTYRYRRDQTRFRRYDLTENARDFGVEVFRRMPENVRSGVRKIWAK
jgi:CelD/BcsL family acetyltransferase involved in cellulose biosynthesis